MTDDFSQLENQLRALVPGAPSDGLARRVAEAMCDPVPCARPWWEKLGFHHPMAAFGWGIVVPSGAVAMALTLLHLSVAAPSPARAVRSEDREIPLASDSTRAVQDDLRTRVGAPSQIQDGNASTVLYETNDEGVVMTGDQQAAHRFRYVSEDTLRWRNPRTGASIEISYPREDVVLTPISAK